MSEPREGVDRAAWDAAVARARDASARGEHRRALELLDGLVDLDPLAPLPHHLRGKALESGSGSGAAADPAPSGGAAEAFFLGRDYDQLPFRASRAVEDTIRSVAARHGAVVVETRERLAAESPGGVLGAEIFLEHVHPRIEGQLLLADAFYRSLEEKKALSGWENRVPLDSARARAPVTVLDSLTAEYWIERLTAGFPFRSSDGLPVVRADTMRPSTVVEALALALYRRELPWPEAQRRLYEHYVETAEYDRAIHTARVLGDELPFWEGALLMAGRAALAAGRPDQALRAFLAADSLKPTAYGNRMIGSLLAAGGDRDRARPYFERAARGTPSGSEARVALRAFDAIPLLEERTREESGDVDVWADLAGTYLLTGQYRRAEEAAGRALELEPNHPDAAAILQRAQRARTASAGTPPVPTTTDPAQPDPSGRTR